MHPFRAEYEPLKRKAMEQPKKVFFSSQNMKEGNEKETPTFKGFEKSQNILKATSSQTLGLFKTSRDTKFPQKNIALEAMKRVHQFHDIENSNPASKPLKTLFLKPKLENGTIKEELSTEKVKQSRAPLIGFQKEVFNYLRETQSFYYIPFNKSFKDKLKRFCYLITAVCHKLKLRRETVLLALFLFHKTILKVESSDIPALIVPCILMAAKTEEYYPPSIKELGNQVFLVSQYEFGWNHLPSRHRRVLELEAKILEVVGLKVITPPIFDICCLLMNYCGKDDFENQNRKLTSTVNEVASLPNIFNNSIENIAVACLKLTRRDGLENCSSTCCRKKSVIKEVEEILHGNQKDEAKENLGQIYEEPVEIICEEYNKMKASQPKKQIHNKNSDSFFEKPRYDWN